MEEKKKTSPAISDKNTSRENVSRESIKVLTEMHDRGGKKEKKRLKNTLFKRLNAIDKMFFVQNLSVLVKAGFSLSKALTTIQRQTRNKWLQEIIKTIADDVQSGQTFADALRRYKKIFDPLFINMIESGEVSGNLERTLRELGVQLKKSHFLYLKVRNALAYPLIILIAMLAVGIGMMIFVIPNIVELYRDSSVELPIITRGVITVSDFIIHHGILTTLLILSIIVIVTLLYKQEQVKLRIHHMMLRLPIAGGIAQEYNLARFSRVFHSLIMTDMPIVKSLQIIANTIKNRAYKNYIIGMIPEMERGNSIGKTLGNDELLFPPTIIEMMTVAEESGTIEEMTKQIAEHYEEEISSTLDGLSVLIEPILMLILGVGVAIIAVAVLWPMYNLVNVI